MRSVRRLLSVLGSCLVLAKAACGETPPPIGTNLGPVSDFGRSWVFVDAFKMARPWRSSGGTLNLTPEGWVASLSAGQTATALLFMDGSGSYPVGTWTLLFEGDGDLSMAFGGTVTSTQPGRLLVNVPKATAGNGGIGIRLTRTNAANPVRNIRFVMPGFEATHLAQPFHPLFLDRLRPFKVLRFMDWLQTNSSLVKEFSERRKPTDAFQVTVNSDGEFDRRSQVAIEYMVDLCNALDADGWFNMPHLASDDYVQKFAALVRDRLKPERKAYVEYSNETWNGLFAQAAYVQDQGQAAGLDPARFTAGLKFTSRRAVQMFGLWEQVFGGRSRLVRVLASQAANPFTGQTMMEFENAFQMADAYAIAPYVGDELDSAANASLSVAQVFEKMTQHLRNTTTNGVAGRIAANRAITQAKGLRLVTYEGGQHLTANSGGFGSPLDQLFARTNRDAGMKSLYQEYLDTWKSGGGGDLFVHFNEISLYGSFGYWGALELQDQEISTAPKYQALVEYGGGGGCAATDLALCLNASGRFRVSVTWKNPFDGGTTGVGTAVGLTSDTGYFWFFDAANVELVVKVLDGRGTNGRFWVFYGALSDVEYTITVTDTVTGVVKTYVNPGRNLASVADITAF